MSLMDTPKKPGLAQSINAISRALIEGKIYSENEKAEIAAFIFDHKNPVDGFTFYPTDAERIKGIQLVTGEKAKTQLLANNALELEALRILSILTPRDSRLLQLHEKADQRLQKLCFYDICITGECAAASIIFLRYLTTLTQNDHSEKIHCGLSSLKQMRDGSGRWRKFPFFYTLLWLTELTWPEAIHELAYALPAYQPLIKRYKNVNDETDRLRSIILHKAHSQVSSDIYF
jgi:hypothetical protein